ncbi:hypothetical protein [Candidatus Nitronereus thalassa]|uniref:Uncharacterized protein n=1 Tax=Candidatus Nitronereus thalassa TaxID=3020898 RepID=A0ABU3K8A7_9BACT|nr:hypothetical protein [Candidatus Nitronereus thalassa]MDT7042548.1 hypothetical protein [Candidatus Nitronereus thalassa]
MCILLLAFPAFASPALEKLFGFVTMAGEAMGSLADGIEKSFNTGTRIYDDLSIREEKERLLDLSANLSHLGMIQTEFVGTLEEFNARPDVEKWEKLAENSRMISEDVRSLIAHLKAERSPLVTKGEAYDALLLTLQHRGTTITEFQKIQLPLTADDLDTLKKIEATYSVLLTNLYRAKESLNTYIEQRFEDLKP